MSPGDDEFLRGLYFDTRRAEFETLGWPTVAIEALLSGQYAAQRRQYAAEYPAAEHSLIKVDGVTVGQLCVDRGVAAIRLVDVSLLSAYRGQGIGTELLQALLDEARVRQQPLRLSVLSGNPAERLYARLGFRECASDGIYRQLEWTAGPATAG